MGVFAGIVFGFLAWFVLRYVVFGLFTVDQNESAVKTTFGRAHRVGDYGTLDAPIAGALQPDERERYAFPVLRVIGPGGPYVKWPWERVHKVSVATETMNMAVDPDDPSANRKGTELEAVTKDQLNTSLNGEIRRRAGRLGLTRNTGTGGRVPRLAAH
jgi:regulator of protease activity HflC (stomatin/prohibitin superfamily)